MTDVQHFDVVVIGGGSGLTAAYYAVADHKSVALITAQPEAMGGTCINFGCIPTKTLIEVADRVQAIREAADFGIDLDQSSLRVDFAKVMSDMRRMRAENASGARHWVEDTMTPIYSRVRFVDDKILETDAGERISGDKIFIAAGARASVPPIEGVEAIDYWTNEEVLELSAQPASLLIVGGGYIGAELGHFFSAIGTDVTIINGSPRLLSEDEDVRELFTREFGKQVRLVTGRAVAAKVHHGQYLVTVDNSEHGQQSVQAERLLLATGRRPNSDGLNPRATGIAVDEAGAIRVDKRLRTDHPDIYAYGDVIGQAMFKHTSSYEGELAYRNACGAAEDVSYRTNPHAVFSHPQIGSVGLTDADCRARGLDYRVSKANYTDVAKGKIIGAPPGFAKLLVEQRGERILGCHIIGPHAAILIHEVVAAMNADDSRAELVRRTIHIHPSLSELMQPLFASV